MKKSNSLIVNFIENHPNDWKELLEAKKIKIKFSPIDYRAIFNYEIEADFSDPIVQEARGIIINLDTLEVVCWPFRKFGNHIESYADDIDWNSARVEEKIDGSIVKLYYYNDNWVWATNGMIDAVDAEVPLTNMSYLDLIHRALNYNDIPFETLLTDYTYIFELVSPFNKIVIDYKKSALYHIGTRSNLNGEEIKTNIGIQQPKTYPINSFERALAAAKELNHGLSQVEAEGFVVVDKNWHRIKIKSPEYLAMHHVWNNNTYILNKLELLEQVINNTPLYTDNAIYLTQYYFYQYELNKLKWQAIMYIRQVRVYWEEYSHDRKAVAVQIKNDRLAYFGFKSLGNELTIDDILKNMQIPQIAKYIANFTLPNM